MSLETNPTRNERPSRRLLFFGTPVDFLSLEDTFAIAEQAMESGIQIHHTALNVAMQVNLDRKPKLPEDVRALQYVASDCRAHTHMSDALIRSNESHKNHQFLAAIDGLQPGGKLLDLSVIP